ncbi:hypothetical protein SD70_24275 [Gordoniibacillus kamchatkensis]|uniref:Serine aminopeptidase S33 domain-containing protein n=1 Tax=Gordoniibacillus kamchatkensis TaxID=1590651 RepID=A0ABR5ACL7_9BACL|nr:alpha/beta hydrolase [Paenibacillus sp. VKM B-2647]KIL38801.1 hypothetical protein SD70_24275 [Paenibacillus sp. VKM B-2647]
MEAKEGAFRGFNGAELFYRKVSKPEAAAKGAIIAVHGHGDHSGGLQNICDKLAENGYIVYAFDMRGHGRSPGIRGFIRTWDEYIGDLHAFREMAAADAPGLPLFIVAHSLGGVVVLDYAMQRGQGVSGLLLIAPAISYEATLFEKMLIACLGKLKPDFTKQQTGNADLLTQDPDILARLTSDPLRHNTVTPGLGFGLMRAVARITNGAHSIRTPLLLQYGLADKITPPAKLRQFFQAVGSADKQQYEYDAMRHRPFDDVGREHFMAHMLSWLDRHIST